MLTGDTLFIGDVGRPDLLASHGHSPKDMARQLYRSLHARLFSLPDGTRVFPAHGAGSACGKNLSTATVSTIGEQRRTNYAVRLTTVDEFVRAVTEGQPPRPRYFTHVAQLNRLAPSPGHASGSRVPTSCGIRSSPMPACHLPRSAAAMPGWTGPARWKPCYGRPGCGQSASGTRGSTINGTRHRFGN